MDAKECIARRVAQEMNDGDVVNLGIGLPTMVPNFLGDDVQITLQSENGFLGLAPLNGQAPLPNLVNAGAQPCGMVDGGAFFDSGFSFALIRGGHVDVTVLGGLQVDQKGNLANWMVPGKMVPGMGGAMDLVTGAKKVVVAMEHCTKDGESKILKECNLPLTAAGKVGTLITEFAVFKFINGRMTLVEYAPGSSPEAVANITEAEFDVAADCRPMNVAAAANISSGS